MKATEQYFPVAPFIMLYKMVLKLTPNNSNQVIKGWVPADITITCIFTGKTDMFVFLHNTRN